MRLRKFTLYPGLYQRLKLKAQPEYTFQCSLDRNKVRESAFIKLFEAPQRSVKIKIYVNFFSLPPRLGREGLKSSCYVTKKMKLKILSKSKFDSQDLALNIEEADQRIIPYLHKTITGGCIRATVLCNDTDVSALYLYYIHEFISSGLGELWMKFETGDSSTFISLHFLASQPGPIFCSVIVIAHILTGCDITNKVRTKVAALICKYESI